MRIDPNTQAAINTGEAIANALAPLAGPGGVLADQVLQGIVSIAVSYQNQNAGAIYTMDDLRASLAKTDADIAALSADLHAGQKMV
jgi:hypothetical protein